jgi:hypothetical protein
VIRLKPLYAEISRVLKQLQRVQKKRGALAVRDVAISGDVTSDPVSLAIDRLTQHQRDFEGICGNTMAISA